MPDEPCFNEIAIAVCASKSCEEPSFIGKGAFKEVYFTKTTDNFLVALKIFDPNKCDLCRAEREIAAMQQCESPFIGKLYDWGVFDSNDSGSFLYVTEEYLSGGTLTDRMSLTVHDASHICDYGIALFTAVSHLKDNNLVHRDIKPDNIMFRTGANEPVLVDFGLVRDLSELSLTQTFLQQGPGTPFFASPEQLNNDKFLIDWRSDQFSIGVILGICLTGSHPYQRPIQTAVQTVGHVISRATCFSTFSEMANESGCGFLTKMVSPWPVDRFAHPDLIIQELKSVKKEITR